MPIDPNLPFSRFGTAPVSPADDRDHLITAYTPRMRASALPDEVGMANVKAYPGIRNQGQEGSCTGHGYRSVKGTIERLTRKTPSARNRVPDFGPRGIYTLAKQLGGYPEEEGAYLRDVLKAAKQYGSPREKDWPYVPHTSDQGKPQDIGKPSSRWLTNAKHWGIGAYARVTGLDEMLTVLHNIGPLFMAMNLTDSFFEPDPEGIIPDPSGADAGGHCMAILAAVQSTKRFYVANSWGDWGLGGFCWVGFDHFLTKAESEAWSIPDAA